MIARHLISFALILLLGSFAGVAGAREPAPPRYSAAQFYQTTTYKLSRGSSLAFSPDGTSVLATSDRSGTLNAYALPLDGGPPRILTRQRDAADGIACTFPSFAGDAEHR